MNVYERAMVSIECPKCGAAIGIRCTNTSAVVHPARRNEAIKQGIWNVEKALQGEYGSLAGVQLEAIRHK